MTSPLLLLLSAHLTYFLSGYLIYNLMRFLRYNLTVKQLVLGRIWAKQLVYMAARRVEW